MPPSLLLFITSAEIIKPPGVTEVLPHPVLQVGHRELRKEIVQTNLDGWAGKAGGARAFFQSAQPE